MLTFRLLLLMFSRLTFSRLTLSRLTFSRLTFSRLTLEPRLAFALLLPPPERFEALTRDPPPPPLPPRATPASIICKQNSGMRRQMIDLFIYFSSLFLC